MDGDSQRKFLNMIPSNQPTHASIAISQSLRILRGVGSIYLNNPHKMNYIEEQLKLLDEIKDKEERYRLKSFLLSSLNGLIENIHQELEKTYHGDYDVMETRKVLDQMKFNPEGR